MPPKVTAETGRFKGEKSPAATSTARPLQERVLVQFPWELVEMWRPLLVTLLCRIGTAQVFLQQGQRVSPAHPGVAGRSSLHLVHGL